MDLKQHRLDVYAGRGIGLAGYRASNVDDPRETLRDILGNKRSVQPVNIDLVFSSADCPWAATLCPKFDESRMPISSLDGVGLGFVRIRTYREVLLRLSRVEMLEGSFFFGPLPNGVRLFRAMAGKVNDLLSPWKVTSASSVWQSNSSSSGSGRLNLRSGAGE
jgi:hypothetical protein